MRSLLQKAFKKAAKLPAEDQDAIAVAVMGELVDRRRWTVKLRRDHKKLSRLADEALAEMRAGIAKPMRLGRSK